MTKRQTRLSHESFTAILEQMLAGPSTATELTQASGMTQRYINQLIRTMHQRKVVHVSGWEKDAIGRVAVKVWTLGHGKDAKRPNKPREQVQRDYRAKRRMDPLKGTPFYGLPVQAANDSRRAAA